MEDENMSKQDIHNYEDIRYIPYKKSTRHPHMTQKDRAAQFAPFAALTGHKEAVLEKQRITEDKRVLDENKKAILDEQIKKISLFIKQQPVVKITYFVYDTRKQGGNYITKEHALKKIDIYNKMVIFSDGCKIAFDDIYEIEMVEIDE